MKKTMIGEVQSALETMSEGMTIVDAIEAKKDKLNRVIEDAQTSIRTARKDIAGATREIRKQQFMSLSKMISGFFD